MKAIEAARAAHAIQARRSSRGGLIILGTILALGAISVVVRRGASSHAAAPVQKVTAEPEVTAPPSKPEPAPPPPSIGKQVLELGRAGTGAGQLSGGRALAVTSNGEIVVAESSTGRVHVFDAKGTYQRVIPLPPDALTKQVNVLGAAANSKGQVVVSRSGDLLVLDVAAGNVVRTIRGSYPDLYYHGDVEVAPDDSIYAISDRTGDLAVVRVSAAGKLIGSQKRTNAEHVAVDGIGTMFLSQGESIEVRDGKGNVVRKFSQGPRGKLSYAGPLAYDGRGHLFVHHGSDVLVFDAEGAVVASLETGSLNDIALDRSGALYTLTADKVRKYEITLPAK